MFLSLIFTKKNLYLVFKSAKNDGVMVFFKILLEIFSVNFEYYSFHINGVQCTVYLEFKAV